MIVERIWSANSLRNFNYLLACPDTGEALAIDPLEHAQCLSVAKSKGWQITQILNTHEHDDHTGGNQALVAATGAKLIAHEKARLKIPGIDRGVKAGDVIKVGKHIELECMDTPGHTMCHICLCAHAEQPALFSGDTLFNAGAGNVHRGGNVEALYATFTEQLERLPGHTQVYPGHDYLENNLKFTLSREPNNQAARTRLAAASTQNSANAMITTLDDEKEHNTFMRLSSPSVIEQLRKDFPDLPANPDRLTVFKKLRELRNTW